MNRRDVLMGLPPVLAVLADGVCHAQSVHMMKPDESIGLEHTTREARLRRLVRELHIQPEPTFYSYIIPAAVMPADFRYDVPVLRVVFPENTFFDTGKSEIVPTAWAIVEAMAETLNGDVPDVALFVAGHTDNRGSESYNQGLSVQRARSVAGALRTAGANAPDIWSVGFGQNLPLYPNTSPTYMSYNRRVEFLFGAKIEAVANWLKDQIDLACSGVEGNLKQSCLVSLKVHNGYLVEPVDRVEHVDSAERQVRAAIPKPTQQVVKPVQRQIVINLAERTFIVRHPET